MHIIYRKRFKKVWFPESAKKEGFYYAKKDHGRTDTLENEAEPKTPASKGGKTGGEDLADEGIWQTLL